MTRSRAIVGVAGAFVVLFATFGWFLFRDVVALRAEMLSAHTALSDARRDLPDLDAAAAGLEHADARLAAARMRLDGRTLRLAGLLPVLGTNVTVLSDLIEAGSVSVDVLRQGLDAARPLLDPSTPPRAEDGRLPTEALQELDRDLAGLPVDRLRMARDRLVAHPRRWLPQQLDGAVDEAVDGASALLDAVDAAREASALLPSALGTEAPRHYLLAMQNSAELRGTGGLIGFEAVLTIDAGRLSLSELGGNEHVVVPAGAVTLAEDLHDRYGSAAPERSLLNVNVHPDLPTTGALLVEVYRAATGLSLDGVIAIDVPGLAGLLDGSGPIRVPEEFRREPGFTAAFPPKALVTALLVDAYEVHGGATEIRERFHRAVAEQVFDRLLHLEWDVKFLRRASHAVAGRHLQLYSVHPEEQRALEARGIAGRLGATGAADLLALTANNAAGNKQDVHVAHRVAAKVLLSVETATGTRALQARRELSMTVKLDNPLPRGGMDPYILRSSLSGPDGPVEGPAGLNRTWFTVWLDGETELLSGRSGPDPLVARAHTFRGLLAIDHVLDTPAEQTRSFSVDTAGPVGLTWNEAGELVYRLTWWRQAKAIPDALDVSIEAPPGWRIVGASATAPGGAPDTSDKLEVRSGNGGARFVGEVSTVMDLEVRMTPAVGD